MSSEEQWSPAQLADTFSRAAKGLARTFDDAMAELGLSLPRARVLIQLERGGPSRVTALAAELGITQGTASSLLDALINEGLVSRSGDPSDGRITLALLTSRGSQLARRADERYAATAAQAFRPLDAASRRHLGALLASLQHTA